MMTHDDAPMPLHAMRKIEIIVHAADLKLVEAILRDAAIAGWSMIRDVAGMGHGGFHQARTIFSDETGLVMFVAVGNDQRVGNAARQLQQLFAQRPGVLFLSNVEVLRSDYVGGG
jgi:nitrogen regulatory protein PII